MILSYSVFTRQHIHLLVFLPEEQLIKAAVFLMEIQIS